MATPELQRGGLRVKSAFNAASPQVHGIEPSYQLIRTLDLEAGRQFNWEDERGEHRVAIVGADIAKQLFAGRDPIGQPVTLNGLSYTVVGRIRHKEQDSNYSGPDNDKVFVPFATMAKDFPIPNAMVPGQVSNIIVAPHEWVVDDLPRQLADAHRQDPRHRLGAREGRADGARAPQGLRPGRHGSHVDVGHLA